MTIYGQMKLDDPKYVQMEADIRTQQLKVKHVPQGLKQLWESTPIPDIDGHTYIVTRHPNGHYDCRDETGKPDVRRAIHGHCHHVLGCIQMLENIIVKKPRRLSKRNEKVVEIIKTKRRHANTQLAWEEVQNELPERLAFVFHEIMFNPGQTRWQLTQTCRMTWRSLTPVVTMLKDMGMIIEGENVVVGGNMPSATIYVNPEIFVSNNGKVN